MDVIKKSIYEEEFNNIYNYKHYLHELLTVLSKVNDHIANCLLELLDALDGNEEKAESLIPSELIYKSIRKLLFQTIHKNIDHPNIHPVQYIPTCCGAARRNIGIQPLLDLITLLLPSPNDYKKLGGLHSKQ